MNGIGSWQTVENLTRLNAALTQRRAFPLTTAASCTTFRSKESCTQQYSCTATIEPRETPITSFYQNPEVAFESIAFADKVRTTCEPCCQRDGSEGQRPGVDPLAQFKMLIIGFSERIASERRITAHCADSLTIAAFLRYDIIESTPDHSSRSVLPSRQPNGVYVGVIARVLRPLKHPKLRNGRHLAIDSPT